jgi:hypothetical protein
MEFSLLPTSTQMLTTQVLASTSLIIHDTGCRSDVLGFANAIDSIELPTVTATANYDYPITGKVFIPVFNQAIHCRFMKNQLLCPMHCCINGVVINQTPKICAVTPDDLAHLT